MSTFHVQRSIFIEAPPERIYATVRDFKSWPKWSPWLIAEPDTTVTYATDGRSYGWDGEVTGAGEMHVESEDEPSRINYRLNFIKPWKSANTVGFSFHPKDGGTEVVWTMEGSLPWFMFWMKAMMSGFIGSDYDRGLRMLKDLLEQGSVPSRLEFPGLAMVDAFPFVGLRRECPISGIGPAMQAGMDDLVKGLEKAGIAPAGPPVSICHRWSPSKDRTLFTLAFQVAGLPAELPDNLVSGVIPACPTYQVRHIGAYRHLGNAWAAGMMHARAKRFRGRRDLHPFEIYRSDPATTPEDERVTVVHIPAKG